MLGPRTGTKVIIQSYKHNSCLHRVWKRNTILKGTRTVVIVANDRTEVLESDGRTWRTREPAISYFHADYWFNIIGMIRADGIHYYCNLSSPFAYDTEALKYIDYDLDVKVYPDMTYKILDRQEYEQHKVTMNYPPELDQIMANQMNILLEWIKQRKGPFASGFINGWYEEYLKARADE